MRDWGNMPKDIVTKIVEHVEFYQDYETLLKICSHWRSAGKEASLRAYANATESSSSMHTLPWLMLPQKESSMIRRLYSVSKRMVRLISLPADLNDKKPMLSSRGWLLVVSKTKQFSVLNPFSGAIIDLPILKLWNINHIDFRDFDWHRTILNRFILSANPSTSSDFVVFLSVSFYPGTDNLKSNLVFWRNNRGAGAGDGHGWIHVRDPHLVPLGPIWPEHPDHMQSFLSFQCTDLTFYQGEFYGVNIFGIFVKFETAKGNPHFNVVAVISGDVPNMLTYNVNDTPWFHFLVESSGKLLVIRQVTRRKIVTSKRRHIFQYQTIRFEVFELNVMTGELKEVSSLGNRTIFIGLNSSFSVESSHGFKPNCIYYTDDRLKYTPCQTPGRRLRHGGCLYNLTDGKFEDHFYNCLSSYLGKLTPLIWLESPYS